MPVNPTIATSPCKHGHASGRYACGACRECSRAYSRKYWAASADRRTSDSTGRRTISPRTSPKPCKNGHDSARYGDGHCKECVSNRLKLRYKTDAGFREKRTVKNKQKREKLKRDNPAKAMLKAAQDRAAKRGYPCTISVKDIEIPEFCPLLGIRLVANRGRPSDSSPSLDKIRPKLGYVPGNVWVISNRANKLKSDASFGELEKIVDGMRIALMPWQWG